MKTTSTPLALLAVSTISQAEYTRHAPVKLESRALDPNYMTCEQTYGVGSIICGDPDTSHFCYDPSKGETCCLMDNGYCKAGDFCAPVVGFCCHNGEDPQTCATRLSFTLPYFIPTASPSPQQEQALSTSILIDTLPLSTPVIGIETPVSTTLDLLAEGEAETSTIERVAATATNTVTEILPASQNDFIKPTSAAGKGERTKVGNEGVFTSATEKTMVPESTTVVNGTAGRDNGTVAGGASTGVLPEFVGGANAGVVRMESVGLVLGVVAGLMVLL